jgi:hypothetical protein
VIHFGLRGAVFGMLLSAVSYAVMLALSFYRVSRLRIVKAEAI